VRILAILLALTLSAAEAAAASRADRLAALAYLMTGVGTRLAVRCSDRLPEYRARFDAVLAAWTARYRDRIERGRQLARAAAMDGEPELDAALDRRNAQAAREFPRLPEAEVRARCDAILHELRIE